MNDSPDLIIFPAVYATASIGCGATFLEGGIGYVDIDQPAVVLHTAEARKHAD
jgi:hypothetical protein